MDVYKMWFHFIFSTVLVFYGITKTLLIKYLIIFIYLLFVVKLSSGAVAKWEVLEKFYENEASRPIRLCPKLTMNHLKLPFGWAMKVSPAAQLLSHSVKAGLQTLVLEGIIDQEATAGTIEFVDKINDLWDLMNSCKPFLKSIKTVVTLQILPPNFRET